MHKCTQTLAHAHVCVPSTSTCEYLAQARVSTLHKHVCVPCTSTCVYLAQTCVCTSHKHVCVPCTSTCVYLALQKASSVLESNTLQLLYFVTRAAGSHAATYLGDFQLQKRVAICFQCLRPIHRSCYTLSYSGSHVVLQHIWVNYSCRKGSLSVFSA